MKSLIPKMYQENIYTINYEKLKKENIKCLLFDLDNTCVGYHEKNPTKELKNLFEKLVKMGFKVIIFSNATSKRLEPFNTLNVGLHPASRKPFKKNFHKILTNYSYKKSEVCIIGDQLFTDILGGNRIGIKTCLVNPMTNEDFIFTKLFRATEELMFKNFSKKNILKKGEYYD